MPLRRILIAISFAVLPGAASAIELGLPAACTLGKDCFLQQFPDMDPGKGAVDPFCGAATYDGHDGTDLRVLSMTDVQHGVPVLAVADGKVMRLRDGEPDRLVTTPEQRLLVGPKECGNGLIINHGDGIETQYCHLRRGSIAVRQGDTVKRGDKIGEIGASGMAQFPHVHVTVRRNGVPVDPATGRDLPAGCLRDSAAAKPLFDPAVVEALGRGDTQIIASGLAGDPIDHADLTVSGPPRIADGRSPNAVAWGWLINLHKGDRVNLRLLDGSGAVVSEQVTEPMDRSKATYSAFAGKRGAPKPGQYTVEVGLLRDGKTVVEKKESYEVK